MKEPKISVIVPVYNAEKFLRKCVDSILSQTFTDFELLLIDDGSKDKSGEICDAYANDDHRIRVFHKKNGGVSSARNLGIEKARGEWIGFVDADDIIYNDNLAVLYGAGMKDASIGFVIGNYYYRTKGKLAKASSIESCMLKEPFAALYKGEVSIRAGAILIKKNVVSNFKFDTHITVHEDTKMWHHILNNTNTYFASDIIHEYLMDNSHLSCCNCKINQEYGYQLSLSDFTGYERLILEELVVGTTIRRIFLKDYCGASKILLKNFFYLPTLLFVYIKRKLRR